MALSHAHAAGVVHGALSTSCVLIDLNGDAIVADLGLASALAAAGTPGVDDDAAALAYASPEVVRGERPSALAEQYAFGVLAYELLAGRRPFDGSGSKLRQAHLRRIPDPIDTPHNDFPQDRSHAVMRMLEKEPADRFESHDKPARTNTPDHRRQDRATAPPRTRAVVGCHAAEGALGPPAGERSCQPVPAAPRLRLSPPTLPMASLVKELLDAAPHRAPRIAARNVGSRVRAIMAAAAVAVCVLSWYQLAPSTRARLWTTLLFERPLEWYSMPAPSPSAVAQPALTVAAPVETVAPVAPPREERPPTPPPRAPVTPTRVASATRADPGVQRIADRSLDAREKAPDPVVVAPVVVPPAVVPPAVASQGAPSPPASTTPPAPAANAESSATSHVPSIADASTAARAVVDQLRRANVYALGASMVASKVDQDFVDWLARRPVDLEVGAPSAPRVAPTSDGGAQVTYSVPITWTHASGARPTRTATLVVAVRPSPTGATVGNWSLAQPFVP